MKFLLKRSTETAVSGCLRVLLLTIPVNPILGVINTTIFLSNTSDGLLNEFEGIV